MGVRGYRRGRLEPLPVGGARDCWPPPARVVMGVMVEVGEVVDAVPPVDDRDEDEDEDDAHDAVNPLPPYLGRPQSLTTSDPLLER